ncbi:hypothetical protein Tsubulata_024066, partial [Turnera subulata]
EIVFFSLPTPPTSKKIHDPKIDRFPLSRPSPRLLAATVSLSQLTVAAITQEHKAEEPRRTRRTGACNRAAIACQLRGYVVGGRCHGRLIPAVRISSSSSSDSFPMVSVDLVETWVQVGVPNPLMEGLSSDAIHSHSLRCFQRTCSGGSSKPLMMFGTEGSGTLTSPSNQLWNDKDIELQADMDRFVEDGSIEDNVDSFLSHVDTDPRDTIPRSMAVSKGDACGKKKVVPCVNSSWGKSYDG